MKTSDSMLKIFRTKVEEARRRGGRNNLISFERYNSEGRPRETDLRILIDGSSSHPEVRGDAHGALTQLFREEATLQFSPKQLVEAVYKNPMKVDHQQYYDLKKNEVTGRGGIHLGVEIAMDDRGELTRTFYVRGPWLGQRIKQNMRAYMKDSKKLLPPDAEL